MPLGRPADGPDGRQNVAVVWETGQDQPWFLATHLPRLGGLRPSRIFAHRMSIQEYCRDAKSLRNGFSLRLSLIRSPQRLERLLLILALAYRLLATIALHAGDTWRSGLGAYCDRPFYPGQRLVLCLPLTGENGRRNIYATVTRCRPTEDGYRVGMAFDRVSLGSWTAAQDVSAAA